MTYPPPSSEPVALIGSSCRFAGGVTSPQRLSTLLSNPPDLSRPVPPTRFSAHGFSHPDAEYHGTTNSARGYWLDQDHRAFDAHFFHIPPKEAEAIDPQQRMLLEVTYEALESAGYYHPQQQKHAGGGGGGDVGVYVGVMTCDYDTLSARDDLNTSRYVATGNARSMLSSRLSYFFDFRGASMTIDAACSSSLVALHQGVQSVRSGESVMACVAGVNLMLTPEQFAAESSLHMLSPTGHCRMWDAGADGYARGEGVVVFFLKTLSRALADGDNIQAVIRDTGVNSDGKTSGITVPSSLAQRDLIRSTYLRSGLDPMDPRHRPQFFEAHGTGTPVGDPVEARAIYEAFFGEVSSKIVDHEQPEDVGGSLFVGSVKTVLGHTEGAAGLAGLLKTVQAMTDETIFPNLHLGKLNPALSCYNGRLQVPVEKIFWPSPKGQPRRASVNSFGFGGTNAHAIVEEYKPEIHNLYARNFTSRLPSHLLHSTTKPHVSQLLKNSSKITLPLLLSADSQHSLQSTLVKFNDLLLKDSGPSYEQICWHLYNNRAAHRIRVAIVADDRLKASQIINSMVEAGKQTHRSVLDVQNQIGTRPKRLTSNGPNILGIFTGQGAQYAAMSSGLFRISSVYRDTIKSLDRILQNCPDPPAWSIQGQLLASREHSQLETAAISQPVCTAVQIALVEFLKSVGVRFGCVVGHSSGEIAAAYAAGRLGQRDAMLIAYYRGRYAHLASGSDGQRGGMLACGLSREEAGRLCSRPKYEGRICVAASNSPSLVTLSGDIDVLRSLLDKLKHRGVFARLLNVDTAYHSSHMRRAVDAYSEALSKSGISVMQVANKTSATWVSSVSGAWEKTPGEVLGLPLQYWAENMMKPVLFHEAVCSAIENCGPFHCVIEVGPHASLMSPVKQTMEQQHRGPAIPYASVLNRTKPDHLAIADFLGAIWTNFDPPFIDMRSYVENSPASSLVASRLREALPTYSWDHSKIHWRESRLSEQYHFRRRPPHELLGVRTRDDNQYEMRWRNILKLEKLPWLEGHKFQGQPLLPASAYCIMALDAARALLDDSGRVPVLVELQDLEFLSGITVEADSLGTEILFTLRPLSPCNKTQTTASYGRVTTAEASSIEAEFTLTSVPVKSFGFSPMSKNFTGKMRIVLEGSSPDFLSLPPRRGTRPRAETIAVEIDSFYRMMTGIGLDYTGPFMALKSIQRGPKCSTATLDSRHAADTTGLQVSPATLDTCFQATFAAFSSPGDRALWTSFLPQKIAKLRFDCLALGSFQSRENSEISVESQLTSFEPYSRTSAANITSDVSVFNAQGVMQVQIEDLTVSSFAPTKPEDDYELYLHTVLDLDPEDEIIAASPFITSTGLDRHLVESCERVAAHHLAAERKTIPSTSTSSRHAAILDTPPASPVVSTLPDEDMLEDDPLPSTRPREAQESEIRRFIQTSPYSSTLNFLHGVGKTCPGALPSILPSAIQEAQQLLGFQKHLGRIVQQISHRYPRMNVLGLTDPGFTFTEHILGGLQDSSYRSYTIGGGTEENLHDRLPSLQTNKKVSFELVSLDSRAEHEAAVRCDLYDLVILSVALCGEDHSSRVSALKTVRKLVKSGGFVVLISMPPTLRCQSKILVDPKNSRPSSPVTPPPDWSDLLGSGTEAECGFVSRSRNSDQHHPLGFSLSIRQADGGSLANDALDPRASCWRSGEFATEHLLLVGGQTEGVRKVCRDLKVLLDGKCKRISVADDLSMITPDVAAGCTAAILLTDLEASMCLSMTNSQLAALQVLMRPGMTVLWVASHARGDPEKAASFGLTRTLKAEIPSLVLQVLDLDEVHDGSPAMIARDFCVLACCAQNASRDSSGALLWSCEPEIHILNDKRLIPRVLPYKPAIERLNAYRRPISTTVNTLEACVMLKPVQMPDGTIEYGAQKVGSARSEYLEGLPAHRVMYVECSSSYPVTIGRSKGMYVCVGRISGQSGKLTAALSPELASIIHVQHSLAYDLSTLDFDPSSFAFILSQALSAFELVEKAGRRNIVLVDPEQTFLRCVRALISGVFAGKRINLQAWSCDEESCRESHVLFRHSWSTAREVRDSLPDDCVVYDFLPEESQLTRTLGALGSQVQYQRGLGTRPLDDNPPRGGLAPKESVTAAWKQALEISLHEIAAQPTKRDRAGFIRTSELLDAIVLTPGFSIIDWKADRNLQIEVQPILEPRLLRNDRTYVLVGLTRDLGQSLCRLFIDHGARNIIVASRNPDMSPSWAAELISTGVRVHTSRLDVTSLEDVKRLHADIACARLGMPPTVGGVVNGAMVLDDRVFAQMDADTWARVMRPKTVGSKNLDTVFGGSADLEFFIMTSSFAAVGGHAGQSNYAAANMYMSGLAADRRRRGLAGSVLNMGVVYGLGFLARERPHMYRGLERDGYPPISERDLHHMFVEAIEAGRPVPGQIADLTTGLARYRVDGPDPPLHWHHDQRFCHFTLSKNEDDDEDDDRMTQREDDRKQDSIKDLLKLGRSVEATAQVFQDALCRRVEIILQLPIDSINGDSRITEIGLDSLAAVEIRNWFYKSVGQDIAVLKILGASCISQLCHDVAEKSVAGRNMDEER